jgi:hypothetical protein
MPLPLAGIAAGVGLVSGGLSFLQGSQQSSAARSAAKAANEQALQNYKDQLEYQKASDTYAKWVTEVNTTTTNTEKNYAYWAEGVNYRQNLGYVNQLRNYEVVKSVTQLDLMRRTRASAGADYVQQSQALSDQLQQASMADAVSYMQYMHQSIRARSAIQGEREGLSVDRLVMDYARQAGDQQTLLAIGAGFREGQFTREQGAQVAQYISRYNSQTEYQKQMYQDPLPPFAPLPTLTLPQAPSMTGAAPITSVPTSNAFLNGASSALSGINTGLAIYGQLKQYTTGGKV